VGGFSGVPWMPGCLIASILELNLDNESGSLNCFSRMPWAVRWSRSMPLVYVVGNGYRKRSRKAAFGSKLVSLDRHFKCISHLIWTELFIFPALDAILSTFNLARFRYFGLVVRPHREWRTGRVSSFAGCFTGATFLPLIQSLEVDILQTERSSSPDDGLENRAVRLNGRIRGIKLCR